jgi:hypothetical protein
MGFLSVESLPLSRVALPPSEARLALDSMRQDRNYHPSLRGRKKDSGWNE